MAKSSRLVSGQRQGTVTLSWPSLVGRLNERLVLQLLQRHGPLSRAEVVRVSGLSAPTVSKAVSSLLRAGLVEEEEATETGRGRPAAKVRLARSRVQVLGIAVDADHCWVAAAGLDGVLRCPVRRVTTPASYEELLTVLEAAAREYMVEGIQTLGVGISLPGLVDSRTGRGILSPNVPMTNGHTPAVDLGSRLQLPAVLLQESHALCLAERHYGLARQIEDFAVLDVATGVGLGVMMGGRLFTGHSGLAGEIGHMTVVPQGGRRCGCGNTGCLETVVSDTALAWHASQKLGRLVRGDEVIELARNKLVDLSAELDQMAGYLALAVATVINVFNPAAVFIHTPLVDIEPDLLQRVIWHTQQRTLPPSFAQCQIARAQGTKYQGAIAGIIQALTDAVAPRIT
ncbi:MAG: ROK family transcriptional regulator [Gemmataceae bacterium]|nr:ROK family transcriptional regulator [Gemmataceae bacterium]MDW8241827.1 ROK family transcriptional regulator [Thermogemmata sp.]